MGSGIAQVTAQAGMQVHLIDQTESLLDNAKTRIVDSLQRVAKKKYPDDKQVAEKFVSDCVERVVFGVDAAVAASKSELVVEAIIENLEKKQSLFRELDKAAPPYVLGITRQTDGRTNQTFNII
jgi:3-hydroxyacyl-CoA dehydrogenase